MGNPIPFISDITQAFYQPKLNAVGVDKDGNYVDSQGKPTSLYTQPGAWQKAFNPQADQIQAMNVQAGAAPLEAMRARALARAGGMADYNTLTPEQQALFPNAQNALTTTGNNFTGNSLLNTGNALASIHADNPSLAATAAHNAYAAQAAEQQNAASKAAMAGLLGTPSTEASGEDVNAQNQLSVGQGEQSLIPTELYNKGLGLGNTGMQLLGQRATIPTQNADLFNRSQIDLANSGQGVKDLPYTLTGQRAQDISNAYLAEHPAIFGSRFNATVNPSSGTITPGTYIPENMKFAANAGMLPSNMMGNNGSNMTLSSGRTIAIPPQAINPAQTEPPIGSPQNPDYEADKITQHPAEVANHEAQQASIAAQIASLKAKSKQNEAEHTGRSFIVPNKKQILQTAFDSPVLHPNLNAYVKHGLSADELNSLLSQ